MEAETGDFLVTDFLVLFDSVFTDFLVLEDILVIDFEAGARFTDFLVFEEDFLVVVDFGLDFEAGESFILASSLLLLSELLAGLISTDFFAIFA